MNSLHEVLSVMSYQQRSIRRHGVRSRKKQLRNCLVFDRLEERILLTTVSLEESPDKWSVEFSHADARIHLSEVATTSGDHVLQYRIGDGTYTTDFDTGEEGDQQIVLDQLDRHLDFGVSDDQEIQIGSLNTRGQNISVDAEGKISLASGAVISTRDVTAGGLAANADSQGDSGSIVFSTTDSILIEGDLFSQVEERSAFKSGDITFEVSDSSLIHSDSDELSVEIKGSKIEAGEFEVSVENKFRKFAKQVVGVDTNTVKITVSESDISAESIQLEAVAEDAIGFFDGEYKWFGTMVSGALFDGLVGKGLEHFFHGRLGSLVQWPTASVFLREASSAVTIEGSTLDAENSITITSEGTVESQAEAVQDRHFGGASGVEIAVGYARATSKSVTRLKPLGDTPTVLIAGGDITIESEGTAKALANVRTMAQYPEKEGGDYDLKSPASVKMVAVAITDAELTVLNDIQKNVLIESDGTVKIEATGTPQSIPNASTRAYGDGMGGVTVAVGTDTSNITSTVNAQITANQIESSDDSISLSRQQITANTLPYDSSHGWNRGDELVYEVASFDGLEPITGLEHGQPYYIVEVLEDAIKLAHTRELDLDLPPGDFNSQQQIDVLDLLTFSPAEAVRGNQIQIENHGLETAEEVQYLAMASTSEESQEFEPIGGLYDQHAYYVIRVDANTIELATSPADAINGNAIVFTDQGKGDQQGLGYVTKTIAFDPRSALDPSSNTLAIDTAGIATGTRLIYNTDASVKQPMTTVKNHLLTPPPSSIKFDPTGTLQLSQLVFELSSNLLVVPNHGLEMGEALIYQLESGAVLQPTKSEALHDGQTLYAIVIDEDRFQLALTSDDASNAQAIVFQPPESGVHHLQASQNRTIVFDPTAEVSLDVLDATQNNIFFPTPHGLVSGQRVTYQAGNGNAEVGGLVSGRDYYVSVINRSGIQLADSRERLAAGEMIDLSEGATAISGELHNFQAFQVDALEDWIVTPNHGLETGQSVTYNAQGEDAIEGLTDGSQYYVVRITPDIVRLAATVEDATAASRGDSPIRYLSLGSVGSSLQQTLESTTFARTFDAGLSQAIVDVDDNTLQLAYPWVTGQRVNYQTSGGDPVGGLQDTYNYYVVVAGENSVRLADSAENAQAAVTLDLTSRGSLGSGLHLFNLLRDETILGEASPAIVFDPTEVPPITESDSTIRISQHGWETGHQLTYLTGDGTAIPGLVNGDRYFVIKIDDDHFRLAASANDAGSGQALPLQNGAVGDHHAFEWQQVFTANDPPIKGLLAGQAYFAVVDGPRALRLAETQVEAELAAVIDYDTKNFNGSSQPSLSATDPAIAGIEISAGTSTNKNQSLAGAGLGGKPNFNDFLTKPELLWSSSAWKDSFTRGRFDGAAKGDVPLALAAAVAFTDVKHTIKSSVNGVLETTGDISIEASHSQNSKVFAKGSGSAGGGKTFALAAGVGVGFFDNDVVAEVGSQAQLDASGTIEIEATLAYPRLKYPTVKDGVATSGNTNRSNPANWPPNIAKWISPTLGVDSYLNVWSNSVVFYPDKVSENPDGDKTDAYDKRATTSMTGSAAYIDYKNSSQAIIRDQARINQKETLRAPEQEVAVDASTTMTLIGLSGSIKVNILRGLVSWNLGTAFSAFGSKAKKFAMGLSVLDVKTENTTLALVEPAALIHTGAAGLSVKSDEDIETTLIAETGSESDGVGLGLSGTRSNHNSVTLSQVDAGVVYEGGELQLDSNSQVRPVVVSGSLVSGGGAGIGASGSWTTLDRKTGSFIGLVPADWAEAYQIASDSTASTDDAEPGLIDAESISVDAENSGDVYSFSVVSAIPTFRIAKKPKEEKFVGIFDADDNYLNAVPLEEELEGGSFDLSLAGDTAINAVNDATRAQIDADGFQRIDVESTGDEALSIQAHNPTHYVVASGAGAISKGKRDGTAVAVAGSVAWNGLNLETDAKITDSQPSATQVPITVAGDILVFASTGEPETGHDIDDTEAAIWAVSGALGVAISGDFTISIAFSASINDLDSHTDAVVEYVALNAGTTAVPDSGQVEIQAVSNHTITGDGGGFAIAYGQAALDEDPEGGGSLSVAFGGSYAYNLIDATIDARVGSGTTVDANSLDVSAVDGSSIVNVTIAGAVDAGFSKNGAAFTFAGATNQITRKLDARVGREDDEDNFASTMVNVSQGLTVAATDQAQIKAIGTGLAFDLSLRPKGTFSGSVGASWATNRITDDSSVQAVIANAEIQAPTADVKVSASSQATVESWAVQVGVVLAFNMEEGIFTSDINGAMAFNDVGGAVLAEISDQTVIHSSGTVDVWAESSSEITCEIIDISLSVSLSVVNVGVGLTLAENNLTVDVRAGVQQSTINTIEQLNVNATSTETIEAIGSNASVAIAISLKGASIDVGLIGMVTLNTVDGATQAVISDSRVESEGEVAVRSTDHSTVTASGYGGQLAFAFASGTAVELNAFVQWATNDVTREVDAGIEATNSDATVIDSVGKVSISADKTALVHAKLYTIAIDVSASSGAAFAVGGSDTSVVNRLEKTDDSEYDSSTIARITRASVTASQVEVKSQSTPQLQAWVETVDAQGAFGAGGTLALVAGVSTIDATLADQVEAIVEAEANVVTTADDLIVKAELLSKESTEDDPQQSLYLRGETVSAAVSISADGVSFAGSEAGSYLNYESASTVRALVKDSHVDAKGNIDLDASDQTTALSETRDMSFSLSVVSVAAATPVADGKMKNVVSAEILSTNQATASDPIEVRSESGHITVDSTSKTSSEIATLVITGQVGIGFSTDIVFAESVVANQTSANVQNEEGSQLLKVEALQGDLSVVAVNDDHSKNTVTSGNVSVGLAAFDFVKLTSLHSPTVTSQISGDASVDVWNVNLRAIAEGETTTESQQDDFSLGFPVGALLQNVIATPVVKASVGEVDDEDSSGGDESSQWQVNPVTKVNAGGDIHILTEAMTDASGTAHMIGGSLIATIMTPQVTAIVDPITEVVLGEDAKLTAGGVIAVDVHAGVDENAHPGNFNAALGVDPEADTITFDLPQGHQTGDVLRYENFKDDGKTTSSQVAPVAGLEVGREYRTIGLDETMVQLGEVVDSSINTVDLKTDTLTFSENNLFNGPFQDWLPEQWDVIVYRQHGPEPIGGLVDGGKYWVNQQTDNTLRLYEYSEDAAGNPLYPIAPHAVDGQIIANNQFHISGHGFQTGQAVSYLAPDRVGFSVDYVNADVSPDPDTGEPLLTEEDSNISSTIYLGDDISRFSDGQLVEYRVEATSDQWFWVTGNEADPHSDPLLGEQFWQGTVGGSAVGDVYTNWSANEPNNSGGVEVATVMGSNGEWNDIQLDSSQTHYLLGQPQFVLMRNFGEMSHASAAVVAASKGGWLPSIQTEDEYDAAVKAAAGNAVWLGGSDWDLEDAWHWSTGALDPNNGDYFWQGSSDGYVPNGTDFALWANGEPNDQGRHTKHHNREQLLEMNSAGEWNDLDDSHRRYALVEFPAYKLIPFTGTFSEARLDAIERGGWIARIPDQDSNELAQDLLVSENVSSAWIGGTRDQAITGLKSGDRYFVEFVQNDSDHPNSVRLNEVTDAGTPGAEISLDRNGKVETITHSLVPVEQLPVEGLEPDVTYYVVTDGPDHFGLAASPQDAQTGNHLEISPIDVDSQSLLQTTKGFLSQVGTTSADMTSIGEGDQKLVVDIIAAGPLNVQSLQLVRAASKPQNDGTGTASSSVSTAGGSVIDVTGDPKGYSNSFASAGLKVAPGAELRGNEVELVALSAGNVYSHVNSHTGAAASDSRSLAKSSIDSTSLIQIEGLIHANRTVKIVSENSDNGKASATTQGGGIVSTQVSNADISGKYQNLLHLLSNARITAGDAIDLTASTTFDGKLTSDTESNGVFGNSKANETDGMSFAIADSSDRRNATKIRIDDAMLIADNISIISQLSGVDTGQSYAHATGKGMQNKQRAIGQVDIQSDINVEIGGSALLVAEALDIDATVELLDVDIEGYTYRGRISSEALANLNYDTDVKVSAEKGAIIHADVIWVDAHQDVDQANNLKYHAFNHRGSNSTEREDITGDQSIDWNATVLGKAKANLEVDSQGKVVEIEGVVLNGGNLQVGDVVPVDQPIFVTDVPFDFQEQLTMFTARPSDTSLSGDSAVTGDALFYAVFFADLENESNRDLVIRDVDLDAAIDDRVETKIFWQGGSNGLPVNGAYANWLFGEPTDANGSEDYVILRAQDGKWVDSVGTNQHKYILASDSGYELSATTFTFDEAVADARSKGGTVAAVTSASENSLIWGLAKGNDVWLNGSDAQQEGIWTRPERPSVVVVDAATNSLNARHSLNPGESVPGAFHARNLFPGDEQSTADILLAGDIHNPNGRIDISSQSGNILTASEQLVWSGNMDGTAANGAYTNWNPGEPNDFGGIEDHAVMYGNGKWNDIRGDNKYRYVLETESGYQLINQELTFDAAKADAASRGGRVAWPTTQAENDAISSLAGDSVVWIDGSDSLMEGTWLRPRRDELRLNGRNLQLEAAQGDIAGDLLIVVSESTRPTDPTVTNGDFETSAGSFTVWPGYTGGGNPGDISGWTGSGGHGINPIADGNAPFRDNGGNSTHVAFLQATSYLEQTVRGFKSGKIYSLGIDFNSRNCCGDFPIGNVYANGVLIGDLSGSSTGAAQVQPVGGSEPWYHADLLFRADSREVTIRIEAIPSAGGDATLVIDNVAVSATTLGSSTDAILSVVSGGHVSLDISGEPDSGGRFRGIERLEGETIDVGLRRWNDTLETIGTPPDPSDDLATHYFISGFNSESQFAANHQEIYANGDILVHGLRSDGTTLQAEDEARLLSIDANATIAGDSGQLSVYTNGPIKIRDGVDHTWQLVQVSTPKVTNGNFEASSASFTEWPGYTGGGNPSDISGWMGSGGHGLNPISDGNVPFRDNGSNSTHVAFLQGSSYLEQSVSDFEVGTLYQLGIDFNSRNCCGDFPVAKVYANGALIGNLSSSTSGTASVQPVGGSEPWYHSDLVFRADAEEVTIRIESMPSAGGDSTLVIDNVAVSVTMFTFAQAMAEAAVNDAWLATIRNANEEYLVNEAMDGRAAWYGGTDVRQEGSWAWLTGEIFRTPFYLGNYQTGSPIDGRFEQWKHASLSTATDEADSEGQVEPDDRQSNEDFLAMDDDGNWIDENGEQLHAYVLETENDLQFVASEVSFADAWLDAYQRGGWIAAADTVQRNQEIQKLAAGQSIWLGATDAKSEGLWEWLTPFYADSNFWKGGSDGKPVDNAYSNWNNGEPNNVADREDFLQRLSNGLWNDLPADNWGTPLPYLVVETHVRSSSPETRIGDIVSTHGDIELDAAGDTYLSGQIETRENGTFTWYGAGQLLDANPGEEQQPRVKTRLLQLGSMGGLGQIEQPLPIAVQKLRSKIENQPIHSLYAANSGAPLSLGDLVVFEGNLHVVTDQSLVVDAPIAVEGGGNLTLVSNGLGQDPSTGVSLEYFRSETDLTYTNWASGEPNGCCGGADYVQMYANGTWDDTDGTDVKGGYILEVNGDYSFVGGSFTWAQAAVDARTKNGQLATIQNEAEQLLAAKHTGGTSVWIGATKPAHADDWKWVVEDGYQNWNLSQPDNWQGTEHFAHLRTDGVWNDLPGDYRLDAYLLENEQGFRLVSGDFNWFQAYRDALANGGQLATIRNQTEQAQAETAAGGISAWIGATDIDDPGNWKWVGQESLVIKQPVITRGGNGNINLLGSSGIVLKNNDEVMRFEKPFWPDSGGYSNWQLGEPNNCCGGQNYVQMYSWGKWDDAGGSTVLDGYLLEVEGEFLFVDGSFDWWAAAHDAQSRGGHLAVIESEEEQARAAQHTNGKNVWIGATDEGHEGKWTWVVPKNFENWAVGEPNNGSDMQDHLHMYANGEWDDVLGSDPRSYLLETDGDFQLVQGSFTWSEADADARSRGGHLATILSHDEQVAAQVAAKGVDVWLGANDATQEGIWKWIDVSVAEPNTLVSSSGNGQIVLAAGTQFKQGRLQEGDAAAEILMEPGSRIANEFGNVILMAASDLFLSQISTNAHPDGNEGAVLVVADYDGVTGQRADGEGTIRGVGMATHVIADRVVFVAEGRHDLQGWGIGREVDPLRTQVSRLAALTDFGDVAIENVGDLQIGRIDIPMKGVLKDAFDARSVVPMKTIPERISELDQDQEAPEYNNSDGVFSISGLAILNAGGILDDRYHLSVNSGQSLTVLPDTPVINLSAGPVLLSALSDEAPSAVFEVVKGNFTWDQARGNATDRDGWMANLTTQEAADFVAALGDQNVWIGASDVGSEGQWYWVDERDGQSRKASLDNFDFTNWDSSGPNNAGTGEHYAYLIGSTQKWDDLNGTQSMSYLLERPPTTNLEIHSPIFTAGGTNEIYLFEGYQSLPIAIPIPTETCQIYHRLDAQGDFVEGADLQFSVSQCAQDLAFAATDATQPWHALRGLEGEGRDQPQRFYFSLDEAQRDAATYDDGTLLGKASLLIDNGGLQTVYVRVLDGDGAYTDYQRTFEVGDQPAKDLIVEQISELAPANLPVELSGGFVDRGGNDAHVAVIEWGDDSPATVVSLEPAEQAFSSSHTYSQAGHYSTTVTLVNSLTGQSIASSTVQYVNGVSLHGNELQIVGTLGDDLVVVEQQDQQLVVHAEFSGNAANDSANSQVDLLREMFFNAEVASLTVMLSDGIDRLFVAANVEQLIEANGGADDDYLSAGGGAVNFIGGEGDDFLQGSPRDDSLRGGPGQDWIVAKEGNDYLDGGPDVDRMFAGLGQDQIISGGEPDFVSGGDDPGMDQLVLNADAGIVDLTNVAGPVLESIESINLRGVDGAKLKLDVPSVLVSTDSKNHLLLTIDDYSTVELDSDWKLAGFSTTDGIYRRKYQTDSAVVEMMGPIEWHNPADALDVSGDGVVTPLDALFIVNELNSRRFTLPTGELLFGGIDHALSELEVRHFGFLDVTDDNHVVPLDVLLVLNKLNSRSLVSNGEGEADGNAFAAKQRISILSDDSVRQPLNNASEARGIESINFQTRSSHSQNAVAESVLTRFDRIFDDLPSHQGELDDLFADPEQLASALKTDSLDALEDPLHSFGS